MILKNAIIVYNLKVSMQISSLLSYFFFWSWLCLQVVEGNASSPPIWVSSSFFKAAAVSFIFTTTSTTQTVAVTYSSAIVNTNLKVPTLGLTDLNYRVENGQILIKLTVVSYTKTGLSFQVQVSKNINFRSLKITYMALDNSFTPAFSMNYFFPRVNQNRTGIYAQFFVNFTQSTGVILNPAHENVLLPFMHNIDVRTNDNTINIDLEFSVVNSSYYKVIISSTSNIYINYAGFSRLIFDKTAIEALGNDYFNYGVAEAINNNQLSTTIPPDILPDNLYYGLHSFTITSGLSEIIFTSAYNTTSGYIGFTPVLPYVFSKMKFSYMHHKTRTCPAAFPYYNISELLCYDVCNDRWYGDPVTMTCKPCLYDCLSCTNASACSACSNSSDFRELASSRCQPTPGYYDDGTNSSAAKPCTSPCATCQSTGTNCLSCTTGYYLSGNNCLSCNLAIPNCSQCTNSSYCTLCNSGTSGYTCTSCTSTQYQQSNVCYECSSAITNCQSCTSSTNCALCKNSFTLKSPTDCSCSSTQYLSTTCQQCSTAIPYCKTCSSATVCTDCMDTFQLQSATSCACNSTSYLDPSTDQCALCTDITDYCNTCNSTSCQTCNTGFTLSNGSCVCSSGYYADSSTHACESCSTAISHCQTCSSSSECTTCAAGYQVNSTTFACDAQPCQIVNCFSCNTSNYSICLSCDAGYSLSASSTSCLSVCGDYQLSSTQQCDDSNKISGDGCSSTCVVQAGFSCQDEEVNATLTFSYCYYSGTITFHNVWIRKYEGVNRFKVDFQLNQNIQQWRTVDFKTILSIDTVDQTTNFSTGLGSTVIQSYTTSYNSDKNRFSVTIDYQQLDMEGAYLSFILTPYANNAYPAFTPPANVQFFPPYINCIVEIKANNNQNCNLYSSEVYSAYGVSVTVTYAVVGVAILTLFTSLIFRAGKVITFQMITLLQLTYFSLSFLQSINPTFSGLLPLRFLAGILNFKDVEDYLEQTTSPNSMKGIYMFLNLSDNFTFIALSLTCMLGLGGISYLIYLVMDWLLNSSDDHTVSLQNRRGYTFYRFAFHLIGQISLSLIIVCLPLYSISIIFQAFYTVGSSSLWSYGMGIAIAIAVAIYFISLIKSSHPKNEWSRLGQYLSQFSSHSFKTFKFTNFIIIMVLAISTLIIATLYSNYQLFASICIIFLSLVDIVLVATLKPYRYGFVSCFKGEDNDTQVTFQKIELYKVYDKEQPQVVRIDPHDVTQKSEENENNSEVFAQHFATRKNMIRSRHQGLIQGGQVMNHSKLILFNNNFRRIANLVTLILVEFVFSCVSIFAAEINSSYNEMNIKVALPFLIHSVLFLNVSYNYFFLILQILDRRRENMAKVDNQPIDTSSQFMKSLYNQKQKIKQPQNSEITNIPPVKTNNQIIKVNQNAKSLYDLKRPQIIQPIRNNQNVRRSKNSKIIDPTEDG